MVGSPCILPSVPPPPGPSQWYSEKMAQKNFSRERDPRLQLSPLSDTVESFFGNPERTIYILLRGQCELRVIHQRLSGAVPDSPIRYPGSHPIHQNHRRVQYRPSASVPGY
jgi:hypothetical protein